MSSHLTDSLIAGSISGGVTRLVVAPLDVLKIRFQLQVEPIKVISDPSSCMNHDGFIYRLELDPSTLVF